MGAAKKLSRVVFSSDKQNWATPWDFYRWLDAGMGGITLDVCAEKSNAKCRRYFTREDDGLAQSWRGHTYFDNPEYDEVKEWIRKGKYESIRGAPGVHLVPARVDTEWYREATIEGFGPLRASYYVPQTRVTWLRWASCRVGIYHHDQRLIFEGGPDDGAPFPSAVIIYLPNGVRVTPRMNSRFAPLDGRPPLTLGAPT